MEERAIYELLKSIQQGDASVEEGMEKLKHLPFEDLGYAKIDHHRGLRNGYPEVIYCEGKALDHIEGIVKSLLLKGNNILATRVSPEAYERMKNLSENVLYYPIARVVIFKQHEYSTSSRKIVVATGGTSDIPVAEEAALTAEVLGNQVDRIYDVGVAGIHRLLAQADRLQEASVVIAVAGMEGALASVIGGLVEVPVIAVPTSVGYGANFGGLAALLTMLNSCASGISVVNIDNGFGAGYMASTINRQIELGGKK